MLAATPPTMLSGYPAYDRPAGEEGALAAALGNQVDTATPPTMLSGYPAYDRPAGEEGALAAALGNQVDTATPLQVNNRAPVP
jgi:hypothetical protein